LSLLSVLQFNLWSQVFDVATLLDNGSTDKRLNFVYLGDGYTAAQQASFLTDAQSIIDAQFNFTPYKEYKNFFNAFAVKVISNESGVDHPQTSSDPDCQPVPIMVADTYFNSTFDYYNIHRLLVPQASSAIYGVLASNTPFYDQANVIVNTSYYGGSGGAFATSSINSSANLIMIHEIGHSFVNLADEYWAGINYAAEKANMTQETNPSLVKWKNWIGAENIGIYPHGNNPPESDWYRPHQSCMMRYLSSPFCAVCREATIDRIYTLISPIDSFLPTESTVLFENTDLDFSLDLILPNPNTLEVEWYLDDVLFATDDTDVTLTETEITQNAHVLKVHVEDTTTLARSYVFANGYLFTLTWNITNNSAGIGENQLQRFFYKVYPNPAQNLLNFDYTAFNILDNFMVVITDLQGKELEEISFVPQNGTHQLQIDISNYAAGVYVLNVQTDSYQRSFKFIKE